MNYRMLSLSIVVIVLCIGSLQAEVPRLMSYQGKLTDDTGIPVPDGDYTITFRIYTSPSGGDLLWGEEKMVTVEDGLFSVVLGDVDSIPDTVFTGPTRYLALRVSPDPEMSERKPIVSVGYAMFDGDWILIDDVLYAAGDYGLSMRQSNVLHGAHDSTHVNLGVACTTGTSGQDCKYTTVGGGLTNTAAGDYATVGGGHDNHAHRTATVGGGGDNRANEDYASVSGGEGNNASAVWSAVGGGYYNVASEVVATVGGGSLNTASGEWSVVSGGYGGTASASNAAVGGGGNNTASSWAGTVAGGFHNSASGTYSIVGGGERDSAKAVHGGVFSGYSNLAGNAAVDTGVFVGGGYDNSATSKYATVCGGQSNEASGPIASVGGGEDNTASHWGTTVGGGHINRASANYATVSGGRRNEASGTHSTVGGGQRDSTRAVYGGVFSGYHNLAGDALEDTAVFVGGGYDNSATAKYTTVCGGRENTASLLYATVGGGYRNTASYSYATVGGGGSNTASGAYAAVAGGAADTASGHYSAMGGGFVNTASGNYSAVGGGNRNNSDGDYSFTVGDQSSVPSPYSNSAAFNGQTATASGQTRVGSLSKSSGTFTIDHPTDPANKILNHYFVESPEMVLIYRGVAIIGSDGHAEVHLPDYFDALNRNPMVQLTGVGTSDVYVSEKVNGNRFVIGGKAGTEVYWTVTGDRKDQSAEITRILMPVEQEKEGELTGHFLDDDFLATTKSQLERMGKADEFEFRTSAGQEKYERSLRALEEAK